MPYWVIECRDSDGNDCTVIDFITEAQDGDTALNKVMDECLSRCPGAEEDGGFGAYYPCDCAPDPHDSEPVCECSHGGFLLDENPRGPFDTLDAAEDESSVYHSTEVI